MPIFRSRVTQRSTPMRNRLNRISVSETPVRRGKVAYLSTFTCCFLVSRCFDLEQRETNRKRGE